MSLFAALTRNRARTSPEAADPRLRTRRYAVPYRAVWEAAVATAGAMPRWTLTAHDPRSGRLQAEARTPVFGFTDDVSVTLALDAEGMTVVDVASASRVGRADLGVNARRIRRYLRRLDRAIARGG